jgi:hypothetical protein
MKSFITCTLCEVIYFLDCSQTLGRHLDHLLERAQIIICRTGKLIIHSRVTIRLFLPHNFWYSAGRHIWRSLISMVYLLPTDFLWNCLYHLMTTATNTLHLSHTTLVLQLCRPFVCGDYCFTTFLNLRLYSLSQDTAIHHSKHMQSFCRHQFSQSLAKFGVIPLLEEIHFSTSKSFIHCDLLWVLPYLLVNNSMWKWHHTIHWII